MEKQKTREICKKLFLYVCIFSVIFSNVSLALPTMKAFAEEANPQLQSTEQTQETPSPESEANIETTDFNKLPSLLITELSPNSAGGGTDYFEYIELYNNSNQPIDLAKYSFVYVYTDGSKPDLPFQIPATTIEPQETLVFWYNNGNRTLEEFNTNFGNKPNK